MLIDEVSVPLNVQVTLKSSGWAARLSIRVWSLSGTWARVVQGQQIGDLNGAQRDFGAGFHGGIRHQCTDALRTFGKATGGKMLLRKIAQR